MPSPTSKTKISKSNMMRFSPSLWVILMVLVSCGSSKELTSVASGVSVLDFGARPNDGKDDAKAFQRALNFINDVAEVTTLYVPRGDYLIRKPIRVHNMHSDMIISGENRTRIIIENADFISIWPEARKVNMSSPAFRGEPKLILGKNSDVEIGDVIHIYSNSSWESAWGFNENDIHTVSSFENGQLRIDDNLLFNYHPGKEKVNVEVYKSHLLMLEQLRLIFSKRQSEDQRFSAITARAVKLKLNKIAISDESGYKPFHLGVNVSRCPSVNFSDLEFRNLEYGLLMNYCRDVVGGNILAENCRHGIVPTNACVNVEVVSLKGKGCQGVMDAHMSFNVKYDSVRDIGATQFSNCRALGVVVSNSTFDVNSNYKQNFSYWSAQGLVEEYIGLYDEYDVRINNVEWVHEHPTEFNGLAINSCRNLYIEECTTHNLSLYGKLAGHAYIENSWLGNVRLNSHAINIKNCVMDGQLNRKTHYVFRLTGGGDTMIDNVTIQNYDPKTTYLFGHFYNTSDHNRVTIKNSNIQELKAWTDAMIYPGLKYDGLIIEKSKIGRFIDEWPENISRE